MTTILAIDPGTIRAGWAVFKDLPGKGLKLRSHGVVRAKERDTVEVRIRDIFRDLCDIAVIHDPTVLAVEHGYLGMVKGKGGGNIRSLMALCMGRAVAIVCAPKATQVMMVTPTCAKAAVFTKDASKMQVRNAVQRMFELPELPREDEADAIAIGLYACNQVEFDQAIIRT